MKTILIDEEVEVARKGWTPDPKGSRYCVIDYANDPAGRSAAKAMATECWARERAYAEALFNSLEGGDEETPLLTYEISPHMEMADGARYLVCNYTRHYPSRYALRRYWLKVKDDQPGLAERLDHLLGESEQEFADYLESKRPKGKRARKKSTRKGGYDF